MTRLNTFIALLLASLLTLSQASIPSFGLQTAAGFRSELSDQDFRIRFSEGTQINTPIFNVSIADLTNFPVLAGQDVQSTIIRATLKSGEAFFPHHHARASEAFNVLRGAFLVSLRFEGNSRTVNIVVREGESTVFPQGLVHTVTCISDFNCLFVGVLNSADIGTVPA